MAETTKPATMREAFEQTVAYLRLGYPYLYEMFWIDLKPISYADGVLVVAAPDERRREMCAMRHAKLLGRTLRLVTGREVRVEFVLATAEMGGAPC